MNTAHHLDAVFATDSPPCVQLPTTDDADRHTSVRALCQALAMVIKDADDLGLTMLTKEQAKMCTATSVLVMLGSNLHPKHHFAFAHKHLATLGQCYCLAVKTSADYTGRSHDYDNQALIICLDTPRYLVTLFDDFGELERRAGRRRGTTISLDVDVLAFCDEHACHIIAERLPLKAHELACLSE